jgi:hypothetical protein
MNVHGSGRGVGRITRAGLAVALVAASAVACGDLQREGRSPSFLIIDVLSGASGATPSTFSNVLASDVLTMVDDVPTIFADNGQVVIRLGLKDQGSPSAPNTPTFANYITVTRYRVVFKRSDGRNTPGVDVPHPFDGAITFTAVGGTTSATFTLVRAQAKVEAPLQALAGFGGAVFISTIAEVTFYGHDQTGTPVSATGTISVNFADWGDPT